jgi:hypothetical protein
MVGPSRPSLLSRTSGLSKPTRSAHRVETWASSAPRSTRSRASAPARSMTTRRRFHGHFERGAMGGKEGMTRHSGVLEFGSNMCVALRLRF